MRMRMINDVCVCVQECMFMYRDSFHIMCVFSMFRDRFHRNRFHIMGAAEPGSVARH